MLMNASLTLVLFGLFIPTFYLLGTYFSALVKIDGEGLRGITLYAIGLGVYCFLIILLSFFGFLKTPFVLGSIVVIAFMRLAYIPSFFSWLKSMSTFLFTTEGSLVRVALVCWLATAAITFLVCFLPEISNDSLCYQINLPKIFAAEGSFTPLQYDFNSYYTMLMNYIYTVGMLFNSVALAKLFHWITGIFSSLALMFVIHSETKEKDIALFLGTLFWLTPALINIVAATYIDASLTLYTLLGFYLFLRARQIQSLNLYFVSGLLFGFAISTKLLALLSTFAVGLLFLVDFIKINDKKFILRAFGVFAFALTLTCIYWFIRNWILTGNPVFPYLGNLFGAEEFEFYERFTQMGRPKTLAAFLMLPWNVTYYVNDFGRGHWLGPAYLVLTPVAIFGALREPKARPYLWFVFCFIVFWFFMAQVARYLLPLLPILLIACAISLHRLRNYRIFKVCYNVLFTGGVLLCLLLTGLHIYHYRLELKALSTPWKIEDYLIHVERSLPLANWINKNIPPSAKILNAEEIRQFYINRELVRVSFFRLRTDFEKIEEPHALMNLLRQQGITHVLRAMPITSELGDNKSERYRVLDALLMSPLMAKELKRMESQNERDQKWRYYVFELSAKESHES